MTIRQPRYSKEEFAQRGNALYETEIRAKVEEDNIGRIVTIDNEPETDPLVGMGLLEGCELKIQAIPDRWVTITALP